MSTPPPAFASPAESALPDKPQFSAKALLLGERLSQHAISAEGRLASHPTIVACEGGGVAALLRYGAVVLFDVSADDEPRFLRKIAPWINRPGDVCESEQFTVRIDSHACEGVGDDSVNLSACTIQRLQLLAIALSKSVVLAEYEARVAKVFERIEPLAMELEREGRSRKGSKELMRYIGGALLSEQRMIGRAQVRDKPELLWNRPDLESLYLHLEEELEIPERYAVLDRKLGLISRTAQNALELLHTRRGLRLEWSITILIVIEIVLIVYDIFWHS